MFRANLAESQWPTEAPEKGFRAAENNYLDGASAPASGTKNPTSARWLWAEAGSRRGHAEGREVPVADRDEGTEGDW
jgi:hypothetical protein